MGRRTSRWIRMLFWAILLCQVPGPGGARADDPWTGETTTRVNLRMGPSRTASVLTSVDAGRTVAVQQTRDGWFNVLLEARDYSLRGWILGRYVLPKQAPAGVPGAGPASNLAGRPADQAVETPPGRQPSPETPAVEPAADSASAVASGPAVGPTVPEPPPLPVSGPLQAADPPAPPPVVETAPAEADIPPPAPAAPPPVAHEKPAAGVDSAGETESLQPAHEKEAGPPAADSGQTAAPGAVIASTVQTLLIICAIVLSCLALILSFRALKFSREYQALAQAHRRLKQADPEACLTPQEKRRHPRFARLVEVDFSVLGRFYRGFIRNLSAGGALIETLDTFAVGEQILVSYPAPNQAGNIKRSGEITRAVPNGIGVRFTDQPQPA